MGMPTKINNQYGFANLELNGGKGSGNFGHAGRPGEVGGSGDGKGSGVSETGKEGSFSLSDETKKLIQENVDMFDKLSSTKQRGEEGNFSRACVNLIKQDLKKQKIKQEEVLAVRKKIVDDARNKLGDTWDSNNPNYEKGMEVSGKDLGPFLTGDVLYKINHTGTYRTVEGGHWVTRRDYGDTATAIRRLARYNSGKVKKVKVSPYTYFGRKEYSVD